MSTLTAAVMILKKQITYQIRQPTSHTSSPYRCNGPAISFTINLKSAEQLHQIENTQQSRRQQLTKQSFSMGETSGRVDSWCYNYILNGSLEEGQVVLTPHLVADPLKMAKKD